MSSKAFFIVVGWDEILNAMISFLTQVETIGDAYMCASGLPQRNTYHHTEIAKLAISIMNLVDRFKIRHRPQKRLELRAGIHSGKWNVGYIWFCLTFSKGSGTVQGLLVLSSFAT